MRKIGTELIALLALSTQYFVASVNFKVLTYYGVIPLLKLYFYRRYVLTAAHCFDKNLAEVLLGGDDLNEDPECEFCARQQKFTITSSDMLQHESYTGRFPYLNDIALIRLPTLANTFLQEFKNSTFPNGNPDVIYKVLPICMGWNPR